MVTCTSGGALVSAGDLQCSSVGLLLCRLFRREREDRCSARVLRTRFGLLGVDSTHTRDDCLRMSRFTQLGGRNRTLGVGIPACRHRMRAGSGCVIPSTTSSSVKHCQPVRPLPQTSRPSTCSDGNMAHSVSFLNSFSHIHLYSYSASTIKVPFASLRHAEIARRVLQVDAELQPRLVKRSLTTEGELLVAYETATFLLLCISLITNSDHSPLSPFVLHDFPLMAFSIILNSSLERSRNLRTRQRKTQMNTTKP